MSRFGTPTQKTSTSTFSAPSHTANKPMFEAPTAKASNPFFNAPSDDHSQPFFGTPTTQNTQSRFEPAGEGKGPASRFQLPEQEPELRTEFGQVRVEGHHQAAADDAISGYHFIAVRPGRDYLIEAHRLEDDMDTYMWVFEGTHTYDDFVSYGQLSDQARFNTNMDQFLALNDDAIPYPGGPYGDPRVELTAPESGELTVVVTAHTASGADHGGDGYWDYRLEVIPVELVGVTDLPEPDNGFFFG